jgi:hypothetical protein
LHREVSVVVSGRCTRDKQPARAAIASRTASLLWRQNRRVPTGGDLEEAAEIIREVLAAVEQGKLTVSSPREIALLRRLEGTAIALQAAARKS